jgi:hypothetical protein
MGTLTSEVSMNLHLVRTVFTKASTIGPLEIDGEHTCFILELPWNDNKHDISCIPLGKYKVVLAKSPKRDYIVPLLQGVPGRDGIEIHIGNYPHDTHGCLLPGITTGSDFVGQSGDAFSILRLKVAQGEDTEEGVWITIE